MVECLYSAHPLPVRFLNMCEDIAVRDSVRFDVGNIMGLYLSKPPDTC